ncbi:MAG: hypothetical protein ACE367_20015 [Acidimicrobiales bacterium]
MVDPDDAHVVDLRDESDGSAAVDATDTVRIRRPWLLPVLAVMAVAALAATTLFGDDDGGSDAPAPETAATAVPAVAPDDRDGSGDAARGDAATGDTESDRRHAATAAIPPVAMATTLVMATRPIDGGIVDFVRVDSATGAATFLDNRSLLGLAEFVDIRFFGSDTAVAQLADGSYLTLAITADRVEIVSLVDVTTTASVTPLGLEAVSPDGRMAWVESPYGFFRWDLVDDRIVDRWLDRDGDLERLPRPQLAVASGLVVDAGGDRYLITGSSARRLDVDGEVVAGAHDWVLTRSCDDTLDCGDLELVDLRSSETVELPDERFRQRCGLMVPVPTRSAAGTDGDEAVAVVLQRFGSSVVVVADRSGVSSLTALHPLPVGCLDATVLEDGRVVVFSDTTIAYVDGDDVEIVTTFPLGRTLAGTAAAAS